MKLVLSEAEGIQGELNGDGNRSRLSVLSLAKPVLSNVEGRKLVF
jgi:hypothetical protein